MNGQSLFMPRCLIRVAAGIVFFAGAAVLGGCGQSGPLYLPRAHSAPASATAPATTPAPAARSR